MEENFVAVLQPMKSAKKTNLENFGYTVPTVSTACTCTHMTVGERACVGEPTHSGELLLSCSWSEESKSKPSIHMDRWYYYQHEQETL